MVKLTSSKGTQEKWYRDGFFYKRDNYGGEEEAEFLVSQLLLLQSFDDFVYYEKVDRDLCRSRDFVSIGGSFITFYRYLQSRGMSDVEINRVGSLSAENQYSFIVSQLMELGFTKSYLDYTFSRLFEIDMLVLNVDRHWNNFGLLYDYTGNCRLLTLFDFGYSLGVTFPSTTPNHIIIRKSKSSTVSKSFTKQVGVVPPYRLNIPSRFIEFLEQRGSREAKIFRSRVKVLYKL